jgi:hypothetical protein
MTEPLFWLGFSLTLVSVTLTAVLVVALPALQELGRAARSAEKLFDSLNREFPPTLEAIRLTGLEISELTDDLNQGVRTVEEVAQTVDRGVTITKEGAKKVQGGSKRLVAGVKAAWHSWQGAPPSSIALSNRGSKGKNKKT